MAGTTIKEFASKIHEAKSESFRKLNPKLFGVSGGDGDRPGLARADRPPETAGDKIASDRARIKDKPTDTFKSPEQKLNKLETRWLAVLRTRYSNPGIQNITLRLSHNLRYTPDLNSNQLPLVFFETKGLHRFREKGILKLKWAAKEYPFFDFVLVTWDKDSGQWSETLMPKK